MRLLIILGTAALWLVLAWLHHHAELSNRADYIFVLGTLLATMLVCATFVLP